MDIKAERVREILKIAQEPVSLETPIGEEDDDLILMDTIADESVAFSELASDRIVLEQLFKRLADLMPEAETTQRNSRKKKRRCRNPH